MGFEEERARLVRWLKEAGYIKSRRVEEALLSVPRELFVPPELRGQAYEDRPLPIGEGQTISAPSVVARMTELLMVEEGNKVLEVGTGSGYQAAILARLVGQSGHVWTIERLRSLAETAMKRLKDLNVTNVTVIVGDGSEGYREAAPYDRIIVTAAAPQVPQPLLEQLAPGGILVVPVGNKGSQLLTVIIKDQANEVRVYHDLEVIFVPLIGKYAWPGDA